MDEDAVKITIQIQATPDQADDVSQVLIDYLTYVEGIDVITYWITADAE
jgi:hypothetical protein